METVKQLSFEQAFTELESVLAKLEADTLPLNEALDLYERGNTLAQHCQDLLDQAELRLEAVDGTVTTFSPDPTPGAEVSLDFADPDASSAD